MDKIDKNCKSKISVFPYDSYGFVIIIYQKYGDAEGRTGPDYYRYKSIGWVRR
jgi:hypothetical protein